MNMQQLVEYFGNQRAIAKALNTSDQVVSMWKVKDRIPLGRQYEIQILTGGRLRADVAHAVTPPSDGAGTAA